jgi:toxin HigB-1
MIVSFGNKETEMLWLTGKNRRLPTDVTRRALVKLQSLHSAENIERMGLPPSNRLKKLGGDMKDFWGVRINDQWRLIFGFRDGDAFDVEIIDYH